MSLRKKVFERWKIQSGSGYRLPCWCDVCQGATTFNPSITEWEAAHRIHRAWDGADDVENVRPAIKSHHRIETHQRDQTDIAKGRRVGEKHFGVKKKKRTFRGGRKFNGDVVWYDKD